MKRVRLLSAAALLVVAVAASPGVLSWQPAAALPITVPFELATRHVIVNVTVNGSRPLSFVLDTGASIAIVRMDAARELGLSLRGSVNAGGAGPGRQAGHRVEGATWSLPGLDGFAQRVALALPLPVLPSAIGRPVDGIIGGEFIRQFVVELDYQSRVMTLHDRAAFTYSGRGEMLPLELNANGHPVVTATITPMGGQPLEQKFLLDIGSGLALALHSPFVAERGLPGPDLKTIRAIGTAGAGGRSVGRFGRVASLMIGSFTFNNPIALFSQDKAGAFADRSLAGNIGAQITSRFRMFLDYGRRRLILEPLATLSDPFDRAFSGLALRGEGVDYRTVRVHEVLEDSPASEAGLAEGDIILTIDDRPAADLTLSTINEMLQMPVAYALTIRRANEVVKTTLTPRPLI